MPPSNLPTTAVYASADLDLAERCRAGDGAAFEAIYRAHSARLFGLASRLAGREGAEDLLQDIFLTAHRKIGLFRGESSLGTWLFRLGTNVCLDHLRSRSRRNAQATDLFDGESLVAGRAGRRHAGPILNVVDRVDLERAIAALPAGCRTVFVLHDVEGLDHKEIGETLGIADGTSKSQLHKARMRLREMLAPEA